MASRNLIHFTERMNRLSRMREPYLFIIDYNMDSPVLIPVNECESKDIYFNIEGNSNYPIPGVNKDIRLIKHPIPFNEYLEAYRIIQEEIQKGNSYLVNLTFTTPVESLHGLRDIYHSSTAPYKLLYKDHFLVFSPECFVKIANGRISTFPMKGTVDATHENAEDNLLNNAKEAAEHATIVDLLRNDLSRIATNVRVEKYRYIDKIKTSGKSLLQMSSAISGDLPGDYLDKLGDIIVKLLPAGSVTGAPKTSTLDIIARAEKHQRGYYTGIFGIFDGEKLNSGVMIRYIENQAGRLFYKSGGGLTAMSDPYEEYQELIDKIYVPVT